jgi:hypothetical protein
LTRINLPDAVSGETFATVSALCRFALFNMTLAASRHHKRSIALTMLPKLGTPDLQALVSSSYGLAGDLQMAPAGLIRSALAAVPPRPPPPRLLFSRLAL